MQDALEYLAETREAVATSPDPGIHWPAYIEAQALVALAEALGVD